MLDAIVVLLGLVGLVALLVGWVWTILLTWAEQRHISLLISGGGLFLIAVVLSQPGFRQVLAAF